MRDFTGLNGTTDNGWENCHKPISNYDIMIMDAKAITARINAVRAWLKNDGKIKPDHDQVRSCDQCFGRSKFVIGRLFNIRITHCKECGTRTYIPMHITGIELTALEVIGE